MTKREFLEQLKIKGEYKSQNEAAEALENVLETLKDVLVAGGDISLQGFGSFSVANVKERTGTVPGTNKTYTKPAHKAPKFKFSKALKDAVA